MERLLRTVNVLNAGIALIENKTFDQLVERLKVEEGFREYPYKDTEGIWTFGYGFNIEDGITRYEAEWLLRHRVMERIKELSRVIKGWSRLSPNRQAALINMSYQMGVPRLLKFKKTLRLIAQGKHYAASIEMLDSAWARKTPNRAKRVAMRYLLG